MPDGKMAKRLLELEQQLAEQQATIDTYRLSSDRMQRRIVELEAELLERDERIDMMARSQEHGRKLIMQLEGTLNTMLLELKAREAEFSITQLPSDKNDV